MHIHVDILSYKVVHEYTSRYMDILRCIYMHIHAVAPASACPVVACKGVGLVSR